MIAPASLVKNYYILDQDFSEYVMEMSIENKDELWILLEDYIKDECNG